MQAFHEPITYIHDWEWTEEIPDGCTEVEDGILINGDEGEDEIYYTNILRCTRCGSFKLLDPGGDYVAVVGDASVCRRPLPTINAEGTTWILDPRIEYNHAGPSYVGRDMFYRGRRLKIFKAADLADEIIEALEAIQ